MANIAIIKPNNNQYLTSVNESEYLVDPTAPKTQVVTKDPDVLYNPDISAADAASLALQKPPTQELFTLKINYQVV